MSTAAADLVCLCVCVKMGSRHSVLGAGDQRERQSQVTYRDLLLFHPRLLAFCANAWAKSCFICLFNTKQTYNIHSIIGFIIT